MNTFFSCFVFFLFALFLVLDLFLINRSCLFWGHNINLVSLFHVWSRSHLDLFILCFAQIIPRPFFRFYRTRNFTIISLFRLPQQFSSLFSYSDVHILRDNFHLISWNRQCTVLWHPYLFLSCQLSSSLLYLKLFELRMSPFYVIIPLAIFLMRDFW